LGAVAEPSGVSQTVGSAGTAVTASTTGTAVAAYTAVMVTIKIGAVATIGAVAAHTAVSAAAALTAVTAVTGVLTTSPASPTITAGATAPCTLAGLIAQAAAESWMGLTLAQTIAPGLPFFMGGVTSILDMQTMIFSYGAPELALAECGLTELAHYAGIPLWNTGGCTDSKTLDEQAAIEGSFSVMAAALCGGDLTHDVGYTESAMTGSLFQLCMMDEAIGWSRRVTRGIEVNEETLAVEVIKSVGPNGHYLRHPHTRKFFKTEFWYPTLCDRHNYEEWSAAGSLPMRERVIAKVREILETHTPPPIKKETRDVIEKVLADAEARVKSTDTKKK